MKIKLGALLLLLTFALPAQEYLFFKKKGTTKIRQLSLNESAAILSIGADKWYSGKVTYYNDSLIMLNDNAYKFSQIEKIRFGKKALNFLGPAFMGGGALYASVLMINGAINGDEPFVPADQMAVAGGMIAFGGILSLLGNIPFKMEKYRVEYIRIQE